MPDLTVEVSVTWGPRHMSTTQTVEGVVGDQGYRIVREAIRKGADTAARCFPDPKSRYSDDLFKLGTNLDQGVMDAPPRQPVEQSYEDD